jgi:hypothetical protein
MKYIRVVDVLKNAKPSEKPELQAILAAIQAELDEAWKRLAAHRRLHAFGADEHSQEIAALNGDEAA